MEGRKETEGPDPVWIGPEKVFVITEIPYPERPGSSVFLP
tara:strand:- start:554 stop:673 length:120 start_codon:yes stop_codon:yes gene_type:complete